jgi:tetratricopeptide (TPR) repeat protein
MRSRSSRSGRCAGRLRARLAPALLGCALLAAPYPAPVRARAYVPVADDVVLAELPAGARYNDSAARRLARGRLDVAVPLAQFYIRQSRTTGDLRFLGYADAALAPWIDRRPPAPDALVLHASVQQSRHEFAAALETLDRALAARPADAQALLIRATVLRVLGRYEAAAASCERFGRLVEPGLAAVCSESLRGLSGHLESASEKLRGLSVQGWLDAEKSWRYSELGEMAVRLGQDADAQRWFRQDLSLVPTDTYVRAAYADLLLRAGRAADALQLLQGQETFEPLLLRIAIAQKQLGDPRLAHSVERLRAVFGAEMLRGEAVHRREQARFLLEVEQQPGLALQAALANWEVQREPEDVLVLVAAARAAGKPTAAEPAWRFVHSVGLEDVRLPDAVPGTATANRNGAPR